MIKLGNRIIQYDMWSTSRRNFWTITFHNLYYTFEFLKPIIFADNTNVFGKSAIIKTRFWQQT